MKQGPRMRALRHRRAQADDGFLEAVLQFVMMLPLEGF